MENHASLTINMLFTCYFQMVVFQMKHLGGPNCFQKFLSVPVGGGGGKTAFQDLCSTGADNKKLRQQGLCLKVSC